MCSAVNCSVSHPLFQTARGRTRQLTGRRMSQPEAYLMVRRRAAGAGIATKIGNHTFRATGITAYLKNGGKLEVAQQMPVLLFLGSRGNKGRE